MWSKIIVAVGTALIKALTDFLTNWAKENAKNSEIDKAKAHLQKGEELSQKPDLRSKLEGNREDEKYYNPLR
jgi:aspartokinase